MTCDKCGNIINWGTKCFACGHDSKDAHMPSQKFLDNPKRYRSVRLTVFMGFSIALSVITVLLSLFVFSVDTAFFKTFAGISIGSAVLDIVLCIFILRMKKWAFNVYIGLSVVSSIIRLIAYQDFISVGFKALLLYFIFKNDYQYFD